MSDADRKALVRPPEARDGYGLRKERPWPPAVEDAYQRLRDPALGENHLVALSFGMSGEYLYEGLGLFWDGEGPFRTVRTEARLADLEHPLWKQDELPRDEGLALLEQLNAMDPFHLGGDERYRETVFGEGATFFRLQLGARENEALAWAPYTLARRRKETAYRDLLLILRVSAPEAG